MRMTALDVQNHAFPRRFKGYDVDEVEQFRNALVEDWAALTRESEGLRKRMAELEARVAELTAPENALRDALLNAQGVTDGLRRTAEHEAQMRVGQAELQAEKILAAAHREASRLAHDVRELRSLRTRMAASVRATIETHLALLEGFSQDPVEELGEDTEARIAALSATLAPGAARLASPSPKNPAGDPAAKAPQAAGGPDRGPSGWTVLADQG